MNAAERTATGKNIFHDRSERTEFCGITHNAHVGRYRSNDFEQPSQQGASVKRDEGLVGAHTRAFAACQDEGGHVR